VLILKEKVSVEIKIGKYFVEIVEVKFFLILCFEFFMDKVVKINLHEGI
jgi:hypothetical protein